MKHNSNAVAKALIKSLAVQSLQSLVALETTQKLTAEQLKAARRARQNAALIRSLDK